MQEPMCLTPPQIDAMTMAQIELYFRDDDEDVDYDDIIAQVDEYRRAHGIPGPQDRPK